MNTTPFYPLLTERRIVAGTRLAIWLNCSCLETDRPALYERLGWKVWRGTLARRSEVGIFSTPSKQGL